ncbi:hypothetical protein NBRC110019_32420 [Neptunitalea chrysea]|uniref:Chromosome partitioning protein ParA n=1 Tax=Neptunitalea chrysea TaxID=1647581 RepID=A0A9W6EWE7_9FLAO|nr:hypothetical protein [Neptunitalea chrysea]GLB54201.1 hypothetical protein NBRC110019_32420 [Neptunitalea chrysea]
MTDNKTEKKNNNIAIAAIIVLAVGLLGLSIYTYTNYTKNKESEIELTFKNDSLINEFTELSEYYTERLEESDSTSREFEGRWRDAQSEISLYIDSLQLYKLTASRYYSTRKKLKQHEQELEELQKEYQALRAKYDTLQNVNANLNTTLGTLNKLSDSLKTINSAQKDRLALGSALTLSDLTIDAVKVRKSGKMISTDKARRADRIKVCFTVSPNKIAEEGDKTFFIKVEGPGSTVLGDDTSAMVEGKEITYTKTSEFFYEKNALDVCEYIQKSGDDFAKGKYVITLYNDQLDELGKSSFSLK